MSTITQYCISRVPWQKQNSTISTTTIFSPDVSPAKFRILEIVKDGLQGCHFESVWKIQAKSLQQLTSFCFKLYRMLEKMKMLVESLHECSRGLVCILNQMTPVH